MGLAAPVGLVLIVLVLAFVLRGPRERAELAAGLRRRVLLTRLVGLAAGVAAAVVVLAQPTGGLGAAVVPALVGCGVVLGVALGEAVVRPPRGPGRREAELRPRRPTDYLGRPLVGALTALLLVHAGTLVLTTATAAADDLGVDGRAIAVQCGAISQLRTPYPGSFYSVPIAVVLLLTLLAGVLAVVVITRRPRGMAADAEADDLLRRRSARLVLAATGLAVAAGHVPVAALAAFALAGLDCHEPWMVPTAYVLAATALVAVVLACWFLAVLLRSAVPGRAATRVTSGRA